MTTYFLNIISELKNFSKYLDNLTLLCDQNWVVLDGNSGNKIVYIFRKNGQLLISLNGNITKANFELINKNLIVIDTIGETYLFRNDFFDENILSLKKDGDIENIIFVNESKYEGEINNLNDLENFLKIKYLNVSSKFKNDKLNIRSNSEICFKEFEFIESEEVKLYDFINGTHYSININFNDGLSGTIYRGGKSNKYFIEFGFNSIVYFDTKLECIKYLYKKIKKN